MKKNPDSEKTEAKKDEAANQDEATTRREFLRKSAYAAYATPFITTLLVEQASAKQSDFCDRKPWHPHCQGQGLRRRK